MYKHAAQWKIVGHQKVKSELLGTYPKNLQKGLREVSVQHVHSRTLNSQQVSGCMTSYQHLKGRGRISEFKNSLVYTLSFRSTKATKRNSVSNKTKQLPKTEETQMSMDVKMGKESVLYSNNEIYLAIKM